MIAAHREQSGINNASSGVHGPGSLQGTLCLFFLFFRRCCLSSCINLQRPHDVEIQEFPLPKRDQLPAAVGHRMKRAAPPRCLQRVPRGGPPSHPRTLGPGGGRGADRAVPVPPPQVGHPGLRHQKNESESVAAASQRGSPGPPPPSPPPRTAPVGRGIRDPITTVPRLTHRKARLQTPGAARRRRTRKRRSPPPLIPGIPPLGGPGRAAGTCSSVWGCRSLCVCPPCPSPGTAFPYRRSGCGGEEKPGMQGPVVLGEGGRWVKAQGIWQRGNLKVPVTDRPPPPGDRRRREGSPPLGSRNGGPQRLRLPVTGHGAGPWPCTTAGRRSPSPGEGGRGH